MKTILILLFTIFCFTRSYSQDLIPADKNTLDSIKEAGKGKVILFNYWATWCKPCVEEFPDLLKINEEYKDKDFKIIFVSLDFGKNFPKQTKEFLKKMNVDFTTYYNNFSSDEELINYMDKEWEGSIPGTFIFDKEGSLKKSYIGKTSYEDFKKSVDKYLN
ncbi:MAG TPA: TlpA disulfide reductase family protein [Ignavibacteria bacterium]|nr:TlpA disulfide reductase family protein [Ignavibacteria bacterium]HMR39352.1 TlpA disulfide reductase family protein [Ignavibacteria bacterium]